MAIAPGSTAVVTGAAGGIGRALAARLVAEGVRVVVNDIDDVRLTETADEIGAHPVAGDAASVEGVARLVEAAKDHLGQIDAGTPTPASTAASAWTAPRTTGRRRTGRSTRWRTCGRPGCSCPTGSSGGGRFVVTASAAGLLTMVGTPTVLGHQARRGRLRRMAVGDVPPSRHRRARDLPPGRADRHARGGRTDAGLLGRDGALTPRTSPRRLGGDGRDALPGAAAPAGGATTTPHGRPVRPWLGGMNDSGSTWRDRHEGMADPRARRAQGRAAAGGGRRPAARSRQLRRAGAGAPGELPRRPDVPRALPGQARAAVHPRRRAVR